MMLSDFDKQNDKFWVVYCPEGCSLPGASDKPIRHSTLREARRRATEAWLAEPGRGPVYILEATEVVDYNYELESWELMPTQV
jgi:hypothetical protein